MSRREDSKSSRMAVPALPMKCAITLCVLNVLVPGLGTFLSAFSMCCCGNKRDMTNSDLCVAGCIQVLIALGQLIFTPFFLLGWIWSIIWGVAFIGQSADFYHNDPGIEEGPGAPNSSLATTITFGRVQRVSPYPDVAPPPYSGPPPGFSIPASVSGYSEPPPSYSEVIRQPIVSTLVVRPHQETPPTDITTGALPHDGALPPPSS